MSRTEPVVASLESRKRRLIAQSESNRAQLAEEWQTMRRGLREAGRWAETIAAWAPLITLLASGAAALTRGSPAPDAAKPSWLKRALNGARAAWDLWLALGGRGRGEATRESRNL